MFSVVFASLLMGILVNGYPSGPPANVCVSMLPNHGVSSSAQGYGIEADMNTFNPGDVLIISVTGTNEYRGLFVQVRPEGSTTASGEFMSPPEGYQTIACGGNTASALGHADSTNKPLSNTFMWIAPSTCQSSTYILRATVVRTFAQIETDVMQSLTCVTPSSPDTAGESESEAESENGGEAGSEGETSESTMCILPTVFQDGTYNNTSFETTPFFGGWINSGSRTQWTRRTGGTPSSNTGPNGASDGNFYIYYETSFPAQQDDTVTLTAEGIVGCFCLSFDYNFNVVMAQNHRLEVRLNGEAILNITSAEDDWESQSLTIETDEESTLQFVGIRGSSFRGDMAIDNIVVTEGRCEDDDEDSDGEDSDDEDSDEDG